MGSLRDDILKDLGENFEEKEKVEKIKKRVKKKKEEPLPDATAEAMLIERALNKAFFAPKNMEEEVKFVQQMFTRGAGSEERVGLHASAIIVSDNEFCYRQQMLSLLFRQNQGENIHPNLKRIFEAGNAIHEKWQRVFIRAGFGKAEDMDRTRMCDEYELSYTPDAIIELFGKKYVVEIKSMKTEFYQNATSHPSGRKQCQLYMHNTGIPRGFVLVEDKNDQKFKVFLDYYNPNIVIPFIERLQEVQNMKKDFLEEGLLPKRSPKCTSKNCPKAKNCNMRDACFNTGMGRVRFN